MTNTSHMEEFSFDYKSIIRKTGKARHKGCLYTFGLVRVGFSYQVITDQVRVTKDIKSTYRFINRIRTCTKPLISGWVRGSRIGYG